MNSDLIDLLKILEKFQVKYLIVDGYAVMHYSEPRYTKDLDLWVEVSKDNAPKVYNALKEFGAPLSGIQEKDFLQDGWFYKMGRPPARVDILMSIDGVNFEEAWNKKTESKLDQVEVYIIAKEDLIAAKKCAGRTRDLLDIEALTESD